MDQLGCAFLRGSWTLNYTSIFWELHCCHSCMKCTLRGIASCRIMIQNTPRGGLPSFQEEDVNWWWTPPESPDLNPIENLWHELKEYLRRGVKPQTKDQLRQGILKFWETVTVDKCARYIWHLWKVIPRFISEQGGPTGYWTACSHAATTDLTTVFCHFFVRAFFRATNSTISSLSFYWTPSINLFY